MDTSDSENVGDTDLEICNKYRAYFKDRVRCFLPSCKKFRRDHPNITFLTIPKTLKATWCLAVDKNCPKRILYVCEDHVDILLREFRRFNSKVSQPRAMWLSALIYLVYYAVYTVLLAIAGLWCFEECALTEEEEYVFHSQQRALPY